MTIELFQRVLPNGLRVVFQHLPSRHLFSTNLRVAAGLRHETIKQNGLSHFVEHLIFERQKADSIPEGLNPVTQIEGYGGDLCASINAECASYWLHVPSHHWRDSLGLLLSMLNELRVPHGTLERERGVILQEIVDWNLYLENRLADLLRRALWPDHILGRSLHGSPEIVRSLSETQVLAYHQRHYVAPNMILAMAGEIEIEELVQWLERDALNLVRQAEPFPTSIPIKPSLPVFDFNSDDESEYLHLLIAFFMAPMDHPRRPAHLLAQMIVGDGFTAKLHARLRSREGLYQFYVDKEEHLEGCLFKLRVGVNPARADTIVGAIWETLLEMGHKPLPEAEFRRAKTRYLGKLWVEMDDPDYYARWLSTAGLLTGSPRLAEMNSQQIESVTAEDIRQVCAECFIPQRSALIAWGPSDLRMIVKRRITEVAGAIP